MQIDTEADGFSDGSWYRLDAEVRDMDGNKAARSFYLKVYNSDGTPPEVTIDAFDPHSIGRTTILSSAINTAGETFNVALPSWMVDGTRVVFAGATAPGGFVRGTTYYIVGRTPSSFQLSATSGGLAKDVTSSPSTYYLTGEGHVETAANSGHHGTDADLAGTVVITGTAKDATSVSSVTVEIDGTELGTAILTQVSGDPVTGYEYTWAYEWNTAAQGTSAPAKDDTIVRAYGTDPAGNSLAAGSRPTVTVDVAPYITSIVDPTGISPNVLRGSTGRYSIRNDGNALTVRGYNFGTSAPTVYVGSDTAAGVSARQANNQLTFTKSLTRSGYLTVRVGGVDSFNNVNDNGLEANSEATSDPRTTQWTDDRYLWVWAATQVDISNYTGPGSITDYYYPDMVMNGNQPEFAFTDESVGNVNYTTSDSAATKRTGFRLNRYATMATASVGGNLQRFILTSFDSTYGANSTGTGHLEVTGFGDQGNNSQMTNTYAPSSGPDDSGNSPLEHHPGQRLLRRDPAGQHLPEVGPLPVSQDDRQGVPVAGGADIYVAYYDASSSRPEFQNLNFVSFRMTGARAGNLSVLGQDYSVHPTSCPSRAPTTAAAASTSTWLRSAATASPSPTTIHRRRA